MNQAKQMRRRRRQVEMRAAPRVRVISTAEMQAILAELKRVENGTAAEQAPVVQWASQYADAYYRTAKGALRRVFPQAKKLQRS